MNPIDISSATFVEQHWPYTDKLVYQGTFGDDRVDTVWERHPERTADQIRAMIYKEVMDAMLYLTVYHTEWGGGQRNEAFALGHLFSRGYTQAQWEIVYKGWDAYHAAEAAGTEPLHPYSLVTERKLEDMNVPELAAILWIIQDSFENLC